MTDSSSVKHQPEGGCSAEGTERKEIDNLISFFVPFSVVFSIVLQREGKQLVGD